MRVLLTAGPTREPLDPVRFLGNRSSGKMGYALAEAAAARDHDIILISGPVALPAPLSPHIRTVHVETADEMFEAVKGALPGIECCIMAAAVADFRPATVETDKIKKRGRSHLTLELEPTPDILGSLRDPLGFEGLLIGFAAETENVEENALEKLRRKRCDLVLANDISQPGTGFDADENQVHLFFRSGQSEAWPRAPKRALALRLIEVMERLKPPAS